MKNIIKYFIKFPVTVNTLILAIVIFGLAGANSFKSSFFPLTESDEISIKVSLLGASPQEIEEGVILKIEHELKGLEGVDRITSTSYENGGSIVVEILKGEDIDKMVMEVKNSVDNVPSYPSSMEPIIVSKIKKVRETKVMVLTSKNEDLRILKNKAQNIENDLLSIDGITQVEISGLGKEEIEIALNENTMWAYGITIDEVSKAISSENTIQTGGQIKGVNEEYTIRVKQRKYFAKDIRDIVVKILPNGTQVLLKEIAKVNDTFEETPNAIYYGGARAMVIKVNNTNSEDLISTAQNCEKYLNEFNEKNTDFTIHNLYDSSKVLVERTELLTSNAISGIILVILFLAIFLNTRLAFWVAFGMPISFLGMFIFAPLLGVTINVLSLFGMIIVIGILVDDGIVIAENIYLHFEKGKSRTKAAIDGCLEVLPSIVSSVLTTILAFSTFLFLDGRIGKFFSEVAIIVILTLAVSLIEAFFTLPAHIAHSNSLSTHDEIAAYSKYNLWKYLHNVNKFGDYLMNKMKEHLIKPLIDRVLKHKFLSLSILISIMLFTLGLLQMGVIKFSLFPMVASDNININLKLPEGTPAHVTDSIASYIEKETWKLNDTLFEEYPESEPLVKSIIKIIGPGASTARLRIALLPGEKRPIPSLIISNRIQKNVGEIPLAEKLLYNSGGNFGGSPISVSLLSNNINELKNSTELLKNELKKNNQLKDIYDDDPLGVKEIKITLKPEAFLLQMNTKSIVTQIRNNFYGFPVQRFQRGEDEIRIWARYEREKRSSVLDLEKMFINTPQGTKVPLKTLVDFSIERGEVSINHLNGRRQITVSADVISPKVSSSDIMDDIKNRILPEISSQNPSISYTFEGQNREASKIQNSVKKVAPIIFFLIYVLIAFTFRSMTQPIFLILLIPFSLIGVAVGHLIHGFNINILSFLGVIALIGILINDGLVLISKFNSNLKEGLSFDVSLREACLSRFRAVFLTSVTTVAGLSPLIFEKSRQAQFLIPMAISLAYGIAFATILTLFILPIFLSLNNFIQRQIKWLYTSKKYSKEEIESAYKEAKQKNHHIDL